MDAHPIFVVVYALAASSGPAVGTELTAGEVVPARASGLLFTASGVAQLSTDARAEVGPEPGQLVLESGHVRLVAERTLRVTARQLVVSVQRGTALVSMDDRALTTCAVSGEVLLIGHQSLRGDGAAAERSVAESRIAAGTCLLVSWDGQLRERPFERSVEREIQLQVEDQAPTPVPLPEMVPDARVALDEIEARYADELERGAQQEAAACGCSEDGGGGGSLETGGAGSPRPDPEPLDPGLLRIRVRVPRSR